MTSVLLVHTEGVTGSIPVAPTISNQWLSPDGTSGPQGPTNLVHFVGFRDDRYHAAVRVFGVPDFFHIGWDRRALREIAEGDVVVFADGPHDQEPRARSFPDIIDGTEIGWRWPQMGGAA